MGFMVCQILCLHVNKILNYKKLKQMLGFCTLECVFFLCCNHIDIVSACAFSSCSMLVGLLCPWKHKTNYCNFYMGNKQSSYYHVHSWWSIWELGMSQWCLYWHVEVKFALLCAGDVTPRKKKCGWRESIYQGSGVKHPSRWSECWYRTRWEGYRTNPSCKGKGWGWSASSAVHSCKEKEADGRLQLRAIETQSLKKSRGNKVHNNDASLEEDIKVGERVSPQRGQAGSNVINVNDAHHSRQTDTHHRHT